MWKIGSLTIEGKVVLAPMAGITNVAYRRLMKPLGVALSYTEMVSDCGLIHRNRLTERYLEIDPHEGPIGVQLFGGSKETLLAAIELLEQKDYGYDFLDINLGCPVNKVVKTGAGSAWLKRLDELSDMMAAVVKRSPKPVTAKIRLGWDEESIVVGEVVRRLEEAGVSMIAIHARTRGQLYSGTAKYEHLVGLKETTKIPLVVSGDIFTLDDAIRIEELTHADGLMIARGGLGHPWLIHQIDHYFRYHERLADLSLKENLDYLEAHYQELKRLKGEVVAIREMKGLAPHYLKGYPSTKEERHRLATSIKTEKDFLTIIRDLKARID